ncbi:SitA5 family polymorphic toxin [Myxococcus qinghaiensis]|uniref:SitA5 family polymorphic toxin n=1 Tax=Myxococcus qinghaiensis TaxID=2906758 RepID=UPI0020A7BE54|nr:hypothetical protein [Myxococcus qinghaiensis]MCP3166055.1 hypothetical protein [Myxococcus qinghaiensis]
MVLRRAGALLLALLTACGGAARVPRTASSEEAADAWYSQRVVPLGGSDAEPVELDKEEFTRAVARLAREVRPGRVSPEVVRQLLAHAPDSEPASAVGGGPIYRLASLKVRPETAEEAELKREYLRWCQRTQGGGDCLRLLVDGPVLGSEDRYAVALALAMGSVLEETRHSLRDMADPAAVLALVVWSATLYFVLWALPEPISKGVAAALTVGMLAWLGVDTVWGLMQGWTRLMEEAGRATTFGELEDAGETYGKVMGENTARVLVMLVTAAVGVGAGKLSKKMPGLPGYAQAAAQAEVQGGTRLATLAEVESVAATSEGTFSILARRPGAQATVPPATPSSPVRVLVQHQGGNQQVVINGQRWHVPAGNPASAIPKSDPVGDQLQAAALRLAQRWGPHQLSREETEAIRQAIAKGAHWLARLLEREARGRSVERQLRDEFPMLKWSKKGVDAVDPSTGYRYEVLSGTESNLALHGRRLADLMFRMVTF